MSLLQGSTFINKAYQNLSPHLWIVLSDPNLDNDRIVIVDITTWRDRAIFLNDASCIVEAGEHPFVKKKSYVFYREARITSQSDMEKCIAVGLMTPQEDCRPELLERVLVGASQSPQTPIKIIGVLEDQGLIE